VSRNRRNANKKSTTTGVAFEFIGFGSAIRKHSIRSAYHNINHINFYSAGKRRSCRQIHCPENHTPKPTMNTSVSILSSSDDVSLADSEVAMSRGSNDFVFDMNPRWQSAFLDSLDSSAQFSMDDVVPPRPAPREDKSTTSSSGVVTEFIKRAISKSSSFQHPERRRGNLPTRGGANGLRASSFKDGDLRKQRLNRGESKLRKMQVPATIVAVETKLKS
jgi:hypothetical protein